MSKPVMLEFKNAGGSFTKSVFGFPLKAVNGLATVTPEQWAEMQKSPFFEKHNKKEFAIAGSIPNFRSQSPTVKVVKYGTTGNDPNSAGQFANDDERQLAERKAGLLREIAELEKQKSAIAPPPHPAPIGTLQADSPVPEVYAVRPTLPLGPTDSPRAAVGGPPPDETPAEKKARLAAEKEAEEKASEQAERDAKQAEKDAKKK